MRSGRPRRLSYANVTSTIALVVALSAGTAYAANEWTGANIVDGSLTTLDIKDGTLSAADILANSIGGGRIADGGLRAVDLARDAVDSSKVADNTLTGLDINESTLGQVPSAMVGGLGRSAASQGACGVDEGGDFFVRCVQVSLDLPHPARVLLNGRATASRSGPGGWAPSCRWAGVVQSDSVGYSSLPESVPQHEISLVGVTGVIPAGQGWTFAIECWNNNGHAYYYDVWITAVAISPS